VYHSAKRKTSGAEFALELGTSQMQTKKHYDLPQIPQQNLCHAVNMKQQLFVDQKPIMVSHKTGVK